MNARLFALGVALASFATIALELMLTRIYSVTMYYHFAYMVISLALLGLAVSGVAIYLLPRVFQSRRTPILAAVFMLLFALSTRWALDAAITNPISLSNWQANSEKLLNIYFAAGVPFVCSGFALSLAIASAGESIGRIYAYDLIGAAAGCLFVIPALPSLGGPGAILMVGAIAAASAVLFALSYRSVSARGLSVSLGGVACVVAAWMAFSATTEQTAHRFGAARNPDIGSGVADHDRRGKRAAGARDGLAQDGRIGLGDAERIGAANRRKPRTQSEPVEQQFRQPLQFVGADRETKSLRGEIVERAFEAFERPRGVGDMGGIIIDEVGGEPADVFDAGDAAFQFQPALDQFAGAGADHVARRLQRHRRQAFAVEHVIQCVDQVGRGIDQRAVEIEHHNAG